MIWAIVLIAVFLLWVASRPNHFRVERSLLIKAAPERILSQLQDFHAWQSWSPWENIDPDMQRTYGGTSQGVGAVYEWSGKKTGQGRMELLTVTPAQVTIKLDFFKPFEAHNTAEFGLQPEANGTRVTWAMFGPSPFVSKLMTVFVSMDKMVGKDFEKGLHQLKQVVGG